MAISSGGAAHGGVHPRLAAGRGSHGPGRDDSEAAAVAEEVVANDFLKELETQNDESKRCLALSVLGEAGLRMGANCPLQPESFTRYFDDSSEKVQLAAAVALGRSGAGNVKLYLPKVLDALTQGKQYLLLHSIKELLQHSNAEDDIKPYTDKLWQTVISFGQAENNKVLGAAPALFMSLHSECFNLIRIKRVGFPTSNF